MNGLMRLKETLSGAILTVRCWSPLRAMRAQETATAADALGAQRKRVKARKEVIDTTDEQWRKIGSLRNAVKDWWAQNTFPYVVEGQRLFLRSRREHLWAMIAQQNANLIDLADGMNARREIIIEEAERSLGELFDITVYPVDWRDHFALDLREVNIDPPDYLGERDQREELEKTLSAIGDSMRRFQSEVFDGVGHYAAQLLASLQEGGPKIMNANIDGIGRLLGRVATMQFEGTAIFRRAMEDAQEIITGLDPVALRKRPALRTEVREQLRALLSRYRELNARVIAKSEEPEAVEV